MKRLRGQLIRRMRRLHVNTQRGSIAVNSVGVIMMIFLAVGLAGDGGSALTAREHAADIAREAARAGADSLSDASLRAASPAQLALDPAAATAAAQRILAANGVTGEVTITGSVVTVTAHTTGRTYVLSLFGVRTFTETLTASATPVHGTVAGT